MNDDNLRKRRDELENDRLWELAFSYLKRADDVANYLRALLFALSGGAIALLFSSLKDNKLHVFPILLFAIAIGCLIVSWDIQKTKAGKRFELLRDFGYADYMKFNDYVRKKNVWKNYLYDRASIAFICLGLFAEGSIQFFGK